MKKLTIIVVGLLMFMSSCEKDETFEVMNVQKSALQQKDFEKAFNDLPVSVQNTIKGNTQNNARSLYSLPGYNYLYDVSGSQFYAKGAYGIEIRNTSIYGHTFSTASGNAYGSIYIYDSNYNLISQSIGNIVSSSNVWYQAPTQISTTRRIQYFLWPSIGANYTTNY